MANASTGSGLALNAKEAEILAGLSARFDLAADRWLASLTDEDRRAVRGALPEAKRAYFDRGETSGWLDSGAAVRAAVRFSLPDGKREVFDEMAVAHAVWTISWGCVCFAVGWRTGSESVGA
jgi:hypothetical protein